MYLCPIDALKMNLVIDCGNTKIKLAVFEEDKLSDVHILSYEDWKNNLVNFIKNKPNISSVTVCSVSKLTSNDFEFLNQKVPVYFLTPTDAYPFTNRYATPTTLGMDRRVLVSGAVLLFPEKNRLIIDAGTCITYDFVDSQNQYWGGAISPGIRLRYEALHQYTAKLPLLTREHPEHEIGNSTAQSIHSGVVNGILHEINGFINSYSEKHENFIIILTGGDAEFLSKRLKNTIFANSNFLLESLNQLYQFSKYA